MSSVPLSPPLDILAIAAHRDDVEQTCGGTLLKAAQRGQRTGVLDLTQGEMGTRGPGLAQLERDADGAGDAGAAEAAVATRTLGQVLLVVVLGVIEGVLWGLLDELGRDRPVPGGGEHLLVGLARGLGGGALELAVPPQQRAG